MNEHLLRIYANAAAPADRAASQRAIRRQMTSDKSTAASAPKSLSISPSELKQLLSDDEKEALSAVFTNGQKQQSYGSALEATHLRGALIDKVV